MKSRKSVFGQWILWDSHDMDPEFHSHCFFCFFTTDQAYWVINNKTHRLYKTTGYYHTAGTILSSYILSNDHWVVNGKKLNFKEVKR